MYSTLASGGQDDFGRQSVLVWSHPCCYDHPTAGKFYCAKREKYKLTAHLHPTRGPGSTMSPGLLSLPQVSKAGIQPGRETAVFSASSLPGNVLEQPLSFPHPLAVNAGNRSSSQTLYPLQAGLCLSGPIAYCGDSGGTGGDGTLVCRTQRCVTLCLERTLLGIFYPKLWS